MGNILKKIFPQFLWTSNNGQTSLLSTDKSFVFHWVSHAEEHFQP